MLYGLFDLENWIPCFCYDRENSSILGHFVQLVLRVNRQVSGTMLADIKKEWSKLIQRELCTDFYCLIWVKLQKSYTPHDALTKELCSSISYLSISIIPHLPCFNWWNSLSVMK